MTIDDLPTPALVLNLDVLERNLQRMATECKQAHIALRPHTKTHKSPWVAARQIQLGAVGVCAAKVGEAEVMVKSGIDNVLITTEVVPHVMDRVLHLASMANITVVADSKDMVVELGRRAVARNLELPILADINVGQNRTGTEPGQPALELVQTIVKTRGLRFAGLQAYEGHCQHIFDYEKQRTAAFTAYERIAATKSLIEESGIEVGTVTTAGTGTYRFAIEHGIATEVQPGSYTVMDCVYSRVERTHFENALWIVCSVVSTNRSEGPVVDAGWKTVSIDGGMPFVKDQPDARYTIAGDEHGKISGLPSPTHPGDHIWLIPSHCDTTINLYDQYVLIRDDGHVEGTLPIASRGKSA
jgi:3-hydroxy-D-aspartate aldolase